MTQEFFQQLQQTPAVFSNLNQLAAVNARVFTRFAGFNWDYTRFCLDSGMDQMKLLASKPSYSELYQRETELAEEYKDRTSRLAKDWFAGLTESQEEYRAIFSTTEAEQPVVDERPATTTTAATTTKKKTAKRTRKKAD